MMTVEAAVIVPMIAMILVGIVFLFLFFMDMAAAGSEAMRVAEEMANDPSPSVMDNGFGTMQMSVSPAWADCGAMIIAAAKAIASSLNGFMAY